MVNCSLPSATFSNKTQRRGKYTFPFLPRLHCSRYEAFAVSNSFDVINDWDCRVAGEDEVAVHAMDKEDGVAVGGRGRGDALLSGGETLSNYGATVDSARAGWVP